MENLKVLTEENKESCKEIRGLVQKFMLKWEKLTEGSEPVRSDTIAHTIDNIHETLYFKLETGRKEIRSICATEEMVDVSNDKAFWDILSTSELHHIVSLLPQMTMEIERKLKAATIKNKKSSDKLSYALGELSSVLENW